MVAFSLAAGGACTVYMANVINENKNGPYIDLDGGAPIEGFTEFSKERVYKLDYFELTDSQKAEAETARQNGEGWESDCIVYSYIDVSNATLNYESYLESRLASGYGGINAGYASYSSSGCYIDITWGPGPMVQLAGGYVIFKATEDFHHWSGNTVMDRILLEHIQIYSEI